MRSFSKKLAFVLAAAMVVTSFAPAASAKAADEMAINKSSQILYVNEGINHKGGSVAAAGKGNVSVYDFSVKNKPADWKSTLNFKWTSSNEDVVTVKAGGVATAVGVGKATISCKITDKSGKEVTTAKTKITVKANAYDVEIKNADEVAGLAYEVGATVDLDRVMYDEDGNKTTKRGTLVTDYTRWIAEPSTGVTINQSNGKFTFAEAGEYTLYCETYQSSKYTKATATSDKVKVTITDSSIALKQTTRDDFVINFGSATDIALGDVTVKELVPVAGDKVDKVDYLVKSVTMSEDKKSANVALFYEFNDGASYEITVKGYETETLVASKGAPKTIVLHSNQYNTTDRSVLVENSTQIWATLYDANNIDVTNADLRSKLTYTIKYADSDYETVENSLYFAEVGERAVVTAEYHTYEYDENGNEKDAVVSAPYTFYAVAKGQELITGILDYTTNSGKYYGDKDVVRMDDERSLKVKFVTKNFPESWKAVELSKFNEEVWNYDDTVYFGNANFTALNPDVLEVYDNGGVGLYPRKTGTARVMVSYKTNVNGVEVETPIGSVVINVKDARTLNKISLDKNSLVICANPAKNTNTQAVEDPIVKLTVKDQYDTDYKNVEILAVDGEIKGYGFKGSNKLSQRTVDNGAIVAGLALTNPADSKSFAGLALDSSLFIDILNDMDGNGTPDKDENKQETSATRFSYVLTVQDKTTKATKTVNFSVDVRRAAADVETAEPIIQLTTDDGAIQWNGNDVARTWSDDGNDKSEHQKEAKFVVYQMTNGAKYDEVELKGELPKDAEAIKAASEGYYYVINKGGVNITRKAKAGAEGSGTNVVLPFSSTKDTEVKGVTLDKQIVNYDAATEGAGTYEFILYQIKTVDGANKVIRKASKTLVLTCKPGSYSFVYRDEVTAKAAINAELIKCFTIADRDGHKNSKTNSDITATTIKFNGKARKYQVNLNDEKTTYLADGSVDSVFVQSITVWEDVSAWGKNAYAEYTVPVGYFVKIR